MWLNLSANKTRLVIVKPGTNMACSSWEELYPQGCYCIAKIMEGESQFTYFRKNRDTRVTAMIVTLGSSNIFIG